MRNSQQAFVQGVKIPRPFAFLAVRHMAICGKIVDYISGHKQFDVASAISNFKKILSKNISPFGTVKTESENIWICWRWLYKKQLNKEHKQDAALLILLGLVAAIPYSEILARKNEVMSLYCALKCNDAQGELFLV